MKQLNILEPQEARLRFDNLRRQLEAEKADAALITDNANIYYLTGRVFDGYIYVALNGPETYFVRSQYANPRIWRRASGSTCRNGSAWSSTSRHGAWPNG